MLGGRHEAAAKEDLYRCWYDLLPQSGFFFFFSSSVGVRSLSSTKLAVNGSHNLAHVAKELGQQAVAKCAFFSLFSFFFFFLFFLSFILSVLFFFFFFFFLSFSFSFFYLLLSFYLFFLSAELDTEPTTITVWCLKDRLYLLLHQLWDGLSGYGGGS